MTRFSLGLISLYGAMSYTLYSIIVAARNDYAGTAISFCSRCPAACCCFTASATIIGPGW